MSKEFLDPEHLARRKKKHRMTPPGLISVFNQSKRISDDDAARMTLSIGRQLARDVAPVWGAVPIVEFILAGSRQTDGGCPCWIIDEPDIDGALGYHDEDDKGIPYIKVFASPTLDNGGTVMSGPDAVSVTLSHEVLELTGDSPANKWVDGPTGADFAYELCDAVEGDAYPIDGVSVSNFVLQAFFDPKAEHGSRLDFMGKLSHPFMMTAGGYQITRTEPGKVSQVYAAHVHEVEPGLHLHFGPDMPEWKRRGIINKHSRLLRRRGRGR